MSLAVLSAASPTSESPRYRESQHREQTGSHQQEAGRHGDHGYDAVVTAGSGTPKRSEAIVEGRHNRRIRDCETNFPLQIARVPWSDRGIDGKVFLKHTRTDFNEIILIIITRWVIIRRVYRLGIGIYILVGRECARYLVEAHAQSGQGSGITIKSASIEGENHAVVRVEVAHIKAVVRILGQRRHGSVEEQVGVIDLPGYVPYKIPVRVDGLISKTGEIGVQFECEGIAYPTDRHALALEDTPVKVVCGCGIIGEKGRSRSIVRHGKKQSRNT